jgi:NADH:ubiquinone oxidoreductase subunit E
MGSACHQLGVYDVLPRLQELMAAYDLNDCVSLKGAFCLGICSEGVILKFRERYFTHISAKNIDKIFHDEILPFINPTLGGAS